MSSLLYCMTSIVGWQNSPVFFFHIRFSKKTKKIGFTTPHTAAATEEPMTANIARLARLKRPASTGAGKSFIDGLWFI